MHPVPALVSHWLHLACSLTSSNSAHHRQRCCKKHVDLAIREKNKVPTARHFAALLPPVSSISQILTFMCCSKAFRCENEKLVLRWLGCMAWPISSTARIRFCLTTRSYKSTYVLCTRQNTVATCIVKWQQGAIVIDMKHKTQLMNKIINNDNIYEYTNNR